MLGMGGGGTCEGFGCWVWLPVLTAGIFSAGAIGGLLNSSKPSLNGSAAGEDDPANSFSISENGMYSSSGFSVVGFSFLAFLTG